MSDILIHLVYSSKIGLYFDKTVGILLEGNEYQACIKLTSSLINAIRIRIGTT